MTVLRSLQTRVLNVIKTKNISTPLLRQTLCQESHYDEVSKDHTNTENKLTQETDCGDAPHDHEEKKNVTKTRRLQTIPSLNRDQYGKIENVVAVSLGINQLAFLNISRDLSVQEWSHIDIFEKVPSRFEHFVVYDKLKEAMKGIPEASLYIMEKRNDKLQSLSGQYFFSKSLILKTMFLTMMTDRRSVLTEFDDETEKVNHVCMLRFKDVSRFYEINVGHERVNVSKTVTSILNREIMDDVYIPPYMIEMYDQLEHREKFLYNGTLLLGLAFMKSNLSD